MADSRFTHREHLGTRRSFHQERNEMKNKTILAALLLFIFGGMAIESESSGQLFRNRCCKPRFRLQRPILPNACDCGRITTTCEAQCDIRWNGAGKFWYIHESYCEAGCRCNIMIKTSPPTEPKQVQALVGCVPEAMPTQGDRHRFVIEFNVDDSSTVPSIVRFTREPNQQNEKTDIDNGFKLDNRWFVKISHNPLQATLVLPTTVGIPQNPKKARIRYKSNLVNIQGADVVFEATAADTKTAFLGPWKIEISHTPVSP